MSTTTNVHTWADGFGLWYARVPVDFSDQESVKSAPARARRAIRRELSDRDALGPGYRMNLKWVTEDLDGGTTTFREAD